MSKDKDATLIGFKVLIAEDNKVYTEVTEADLSVLKDYMAPGDYLDLMDVISVARQDFKELHERVNSSKNH